MNRRAVLAVFVGLLLVAIAAWRILGNRDGPVQTTRYEEPFESLGQWTVGDDATAHGLVQDGVYEMSVTESGDSFWVTAGRRFGDGVYQVETRPLEGTMDNGYGMLFRVDREDEAFYLFKVSSDGYVYIGRCSDSCAGLEPLVDRDWFASPAVNLGMEASNWLRVVANGPRLTFFVNDTEVGQADDETLKAGDIGLIAETFTPGGLRVVFDNFSVTPLDGS